MLQPYRWNFIGGRPRRSPFVSLLIFLDEDIDGHIKDLRDGLEFDIRDKPLSRFDPLNSILIQVHPVKLQPVCQRPLRGVRLELKTYAADIIAADVAFSGLSFVLEHDDHLVM